MTKDNDVSATSKLSAEQPVAMLLFCPRCRVQHVDSPEPESGWDNPPHATHTCKACGHLWRPSNANTNGVSYLVVNEPKHAERIKASVPAYAHPSALDEGRITGPDEHGSVYVRFRPCGMGEAVRMERVTAHADYNKDGELLGVEVLSAYDTLPAPPSQAKK